MKTRGANLLLICTVWVVGLAVATVCHSSDIQGERAMTGDRVEPSAAPSTGCRLSPLPIPETPAKVPGYTGLDTTTGLHVTGGMQHIEIADYRLEVMGKVKNRLSLTYDELRCMPRIESRPDLICPGFFKDVATWAGTPLKYILKLAGVEPAATGVRLIGADVYSTAMTLEQAMSEANFIAYEWERKALPRLHGFPVRGVFPGLEGNQWVKWLVKIEVY